MSTWYRLLLVCPTYLCPCYTFVALACSGADCDLAWLQCENFRIGAWQLGISKLNQIWVYGDTSPFLVLSWAIYRSWMWPTDLAKMGEKLCRTEGRQPSYDVHAIMSIFFISFLQWFALYILCASMCYDLSVLVWNDSLFVSSLRCWSQCSVEKIISIQHSLSASADFDPNPAFHLDV